MGFVPQWWRSAVGDEVAAGVRPLGLDDRGRLRVACSSVAWRRQVEILERVLTARVNRQADRAVAGIVAEGPLSP